MALRELRGSGVKYTIPFIARFAGVWIVVTLATLVVAGTSTYLLFLDRGGTPRKSVILMLLLQSAGILIAVGLLAVFTTQRIAGPWIAVLRTVVAVREGNLETRLRFRKGDPYLQEVEVEFNAMLETLHDRLAAAEGEKPS